MARKYYTQRQMINKLPKVEILLYYGAKVGEGYQKTGGHRAGYYEWSKE
jgi:hypothetical protein